MGIPVNALKDDELLHYAGVDPDAAAELAHRIATQSLDPGAEREELRDEIRHLLDQLEQEQDEREAFVRQAEEACKLIRRAMDPEERELSVNDLLKKALDRLE